MPAFKVGKKYKTTVENFYPDCGLVDVGQDFTCHAVINGKCYTKDVSFLEKPLSEAPSEDGGWLVALPHELEYGSVVEVTE